MYFYWDWYTYTKPISAEVPTKVFNMNRSLSYLCLILLLPFFACQTTGPEAGGDDPWAQMDTILATIEEPIFPDQDWSITDLGAVADSTTDALPAITEAIEACNKAGGGRVVVPAGTFYVDGPIHLKSFVNLHLAEGSKLLFSTDPADYPMVFTRWEGMECMNYSPLIYAYQQQDIAITGTGVLDGQASNDNWWPWCGKDVYGWEEGMPSQRDSLNRPDLSRLNTAEVPARERIMGPGHYLRPNFIQPYDCERILIEDVTIRNSPMWVIHPVLSEHVTVRGVRVISHGPNSDGCDPEACKYVLIEDCYFDTGDDCIALKSGRNQDGRRIGQAIEQVVVRNCDMKDGHGGVVIGSEVSGGARHIYAENCTMDSPNLDRAIRVKTNKARGGTIEHLYFRNIDVGEVREAVVKINMLYTHDGEPDVHIPVIRDIVVENVKAEKSEYGLLFIGYDEENPIRDVTIRNCIFNGVEKGNALSHTEDITLDNFMVNNDPVTVPVSQADTDQ